MTYQTLLKYGLQWVVTIFLVATTTISSAAEQDQGVKGSQAGTSAVKLSDFTYKPLLLDAPQTRVDGSTRGTDGETVILQVLAPEHTGLTLQAQPTLYWYTRTPVATRFEIALIDKDKTKPLLAVEADGKKVTGIQQLDLGDHSISLQPEVSYQWSVTQVIDAGSQSKGVVASGMIERMETGEGLSSRIKMSHGTDLVAVYASEGIWYDALETISSMLEKSPEDQGLVAIRASLLDQVGLQATTGD
jgi:hypothetical protein